MGLIEESYALLFPERQFSYRPLLKYSGKFKPYNANIRIHGSLLTLNLAREWEEVSKEIQIGLIQELLLRVLREKKQTLYIDLYHKFVQKLHIVMPKTESDDALAASFTRLNGMFFYSTMEQPNLVWGTDSTRKLASYDFKTDTITVSTIFKNLDIRLLDYVMYHEMLHKKLQYKNTYGRSHFHTAEFRRREAAFPNSTQLEHELKSIAAKSRKHKRFSILSLIGLD